MVVPPRFDAGSLRAILGVLRSIGRQIAGFVDSATVVAASLEASGTLLVLDLGMQHLSVTAIESTRGQRGAVRRRRAVTSSRGGLLALQQAWLALVAQAMVKRSRFDPLHEAACERELADGLPAVASEAALRGRATAGVSLHGQRHEVELGREQFAEAGEGTYRDILRLLHELRPAGARATLVLPRIAEALPGLIERLQVFEDCELILAPEGLAAAAASLLSAPGVSSAESARYLRRLAVRLEPPDAKSLAPRQLGLPGVGGAQASHVLHAGRAWAIGTAPLVVGRRGSTQGTSSPELPDIALPEGVAAVSRRHCTLLREGSEVLLVDHSRYGTFVNGERVEGRTRLRPGDTVRLGDPAIELALIAVAPQGQ
jgi:hypothetical protein